MDALQLAAFAVLAVVILAGVGAYGHPTTRFGDKVGRMVRLVFASGLVLFALDLSHPEVQNSFWLPALIFLALPLGWAASRLVARRLAAPTTDRTIIVGSSHVARHVLALAHRHAVGHVEIVGFVDDHPCELPADAPPVLGNLADLPTLCIRHRVQRVVVTFTTAPDAALLETIRRCGDLHLRIQVVPRLFDLLGPQTTGLGNLGLVDVTRRRPAGVELAAKRILDIVISTVTLTVLSPLILAIATCIKLDDNGPVLFRQERVGRRGRSFMICKFRSMSSEATPHEERSVRRLHAGAVEIQDAVRDLKTAGGDRVTRIGQVPAADEPRRAAAALERPARRDEPGRPASAARVRGRGTRAVAGRPPGRAPRRHRPLAGARPKRRRLARAATARFQLCPLLVALDGPADPGRDRPGGPAATRGALSLPRARGPA